MTREEIESLLEAQRKFFRSGTTLSVKFRKEQLERLYAAVGSHEREICDALYADLGKSQFESLMCEIGMARTELSYMIKNMKRLAKRERVKTPLVQFHSRSFKQPIPYGNTLIMSPWNYPFLLTIEPLTDALAAGNTAIVKPSAYSPATSAVVAKIIKECFPPEYVAAVTGGRAENSALLDQKFDLVFFTGSGTVGREVLRHTAEHLTPAVLELGGKSPCIVDATANIKLAARRIVFGKYLNCGQTCVAPDHVFCERSVKEAFVAEVIGEIKRQFGERPLENKDYGKIINEKHFKRLCGLMDEEKIIYGGQTDEARSKIAPTVMDGVTEEDAVMGEEIFGPILPILTFDDFDRVVNDLKGKSKPLALYLFSNDKAHTDRVINELSYGGGCINDVIVHLATSEMGFGGVGESGMGAYHGKAGFDAFSHYKSILDKKTWIDLPMRYRPYKAGKYEKMMRFFMK